MTLDEALDAAIDEPNAHAIIRNFHDAITKWVKISDDLRAFDGDCRGIVCAQMEQENVLRKMVGAAPIEIGY